MVSPIAQKHVSLYVAPCSISVLTSHHEYPFGVWNWCSRCLARLCVAASPAWCRGGWEKPSDARGNVPRSGGGGFGRLDSGRRLVMERGHETRYRRDSGAPTLRGGRKGAARHEHSHERGNELLTKVLAERLQKVIMRLIHQNQYWFIKTRSIHDCLAWAFEYLHLCKKTKKKNLSS
jgi:hypothetical protein